ncbi:uncharacterized protein F4822DRAFT_321800 [Hypoxylon trugodes]|uniref:uncharacterized protein n=1 Tax=Hypoxylon trugodes TaxID=326681 RepID=UPI0021A1A4EB|nr:uncharacterized protein F4822DRAFT_321800 [Hypoxylon trugodes]KAI1386613.1 hypothetical protein F4822DRAFT_321800 [Hypoxylon trugodes]
MLLADATIVGIVSVLMMCLIPYITSLLRRMRRRKTRLAREHQTIELELIPRVNAQAAASEPVPRADDPALLEGGMSYFLQHRTETRTLVVRSSSMPTPRPDRNHSLHELDMFHD